MLLLRKCITLVMTVINFGHIVLLVDFVVMRGFNFTKKY